MGLTALLLAAALAASAPDGEARISLDVREADVQDVARLFAEIGGFQLVMDPGTSCRVTLKLNAVRWEQAFATVLRSCGLAREEDGGIVRVSTSARLTEEARAQRALDEARESARPRSASLLRLSYAKAAELAPVLSKMLPGAEVTWDARTNTLIVVD
jgi:type IV pilus assembly protein PilQ